MMLNYKPLNKPFSMDGYLNSNLTMVLEKAIPNFWDCFVILFGREGSGKTTLATQICYKLDPNFSVNNIVWTMEQFDKAIDNAKDESAILWDEAITGARANQHADNISQKIISKLTMIRKKRLKILICFPYLYMLNKYFVSRCLFSIYVYAKGFGDRGYAKFYNSRSSEVLYNLMKEKYKHDYMSAISYCKYDFKFRFTGMFCANEDEYDRLKTKYSKLMNEEKETKEDNRLEKVKYRIISANIYKLNKGELPKLLAEYFDVGVRTAQMWIKAYTKKDENESTKEAEYT